MAPRGPVGEGFEDLSRVIDRVMARSNDAMSIITGTLGSQGNLISTLQDEILRLSQVNAALHTRIGELQQFHYQSEQLRADLEIKRAELGIKEKRTDAAISTAKQVGMAVLGEIAARRTSALPAAPPALAGESAAPQPGERTLPIVLSEMWLRLSQPTRDRIGDEAGKELVVELLQRVQGESPEVHHEQ